MRFIHPPTAPRTFIGRHPTPAGFSIFTKSTPRLRPRASLGPTRRLPGQYQNASPDTLAGLKKFEHRQLSRFLSTEPLDSSSHVTRRYKPNPAAVSNYSTGHRWLGPCKSIALLPLENRKNLLRTPLGFPWPGAPMVSQIRPGLCVRRA